MARVHLALAQFALSTPTRHCGPSHVFIGHDLSVVGAKSRRALVRKDGDIVERGEVLALFETPAYEYTRALPAAAHRA